MDDAPTDATNRPTPSTVRPFSRPAAGGGQPTPLATRSVLFVPGELGERPVHDRGAIEGAADPGPAPAPPFEPESVATWSPSDEMPADEGATLDQGTTPDQGASSTALVGEPAEADAPLAFVDEAAGDVGHEAAPAGAGPLSHDDDGLENAAEYPLDELGFPGVPPGYEFALDESPRETPPSMDEGEASRDEAGAGPVGIGSDEVGGPALAPETADVPGTRWEERDRSWAGDPAVEPGAGPSLRRGDRAREQVARLLESLASRVRAGELPLSFEVPVAAEAAVLAGLLTSLLATGSSPDAGEGRAERGGEG